MSSNPALSSLGPLVGDWVMELYGASFLPDPETKVTGLVTIAWTEDGAAMIMRQGDSEHPPSATWIIGRDESETGYRVLYADGRGVSRIYDMSFDWPQWRMWRATPDFSQRFQATIDDGANTVRGHWQKSFDAGTTWEHDFDIDYVRVRPLEGT
jgi:hypothetical protein